MVSNSRIDQVAGVRSLPASIRKMIQTIREVVRSHSDDDVYVALKESDMNPDEAVQKLLHQDPFHEVKRKRGKQKEKTRGSLEPRKLIEQDRVIRASSEPLNSVEQKMALKGASGPGEFIEQKTSFKGSSEPRQLTYRTQRVHSNAFSSRNAQRAVYFQRAPPDAGTSREFRVVRDNRANHNTNREVKTDLVQSSAPARELQSASVHSSTSASVQITQNASGKSTMKPIHTKHIGAKTAGNQLSSQAVNRPSDLGCGQLKDPNLENTNQKGVPEESGANIPISVSPLHGPTPQRSQSSATSASGNTVVGLYASSSDPVHVPSNSRASGTVGAIRREVGVVGIRKQSSENSAKSSSNPRSSASTSLEPKVISSTSETFQSSSAGVKTDQRVQPCVSESAVSSSSLSKSVLSYQNGGRTHQQSIVHQKAPQPGMAWKPKSSQKSSFVTPVITETTIAHVRSPSDNLVDSRKEADHLGEKPCQVCLSKDEHVLIPKHLRVPEADRILLTFGSFGLELDANKRISSGFQVFESREELRSLSAPSTSNEDVNQLGLLNDHVGNSGSASPPSAAVSERPSSDKKESFNPGNLENYADVEMVRNDSTSHTPAEPQRQQEVSLPTSESMPLYRPVTGDSARTQRIQSPGEAMSSRLPNSTSTSSIAMVQQQAIPQLYPQIHVTQIPNFAPYQQILSPGFVPSMGVPGYSNNPAYLHPPNGTGYFLVPGGSTHLTAAGVRYGATQYMHIPPGTPTVVGSYSPPNGYAFTTQGTGGGVTGIDESTSARANYISNPQVEAPEIWIQQNREIPGLQSAPSYYSIPGQASYPAYLTSHTGHASFGGASTPQPALIQYPGLYHPTQQAAIASPLHVVPNVGNNVGVSVASASAGGVAGAQIGDYQQPQVGNPNRNTNF